MFRRLIAAAIVVASLGLTSSPGSAAGARYVVVVNLTSGSVTAALHQYSEVAKTSIASKRYHEFAIPPGHTTLVVSSAPCPGGRRLLLPTQERVRVVVNSICELSIQ